MEANQFKQLLCEEGFEVTGVIIFVTLDNERLDGEELREFIRQADMQHPWFTAGGTPKRPRPSIGTMLKAKMKDPSGCITREYSVRIRPICYLKAHQLHAYNKYLCCLGETLATMAIAGVARVDVRLELAGGGGRYSTHAAIARNTSAWREHTETLQHQRPNES